MTLPRDLGNHMATSLPAGSELAPEKQTNCKKLSAYQCHSSVIRGLSRKLIAMTESDTVIIGLAPCRSMRRPIMGEVMEPTAMKESDALIAARCPTKGHLQRLDEKPEGVATRSDRQGRGQEHNPEYEPAVVGAASPEHQFSGTHASYGTTR